MLKKTILKLHNSFHKFPSAPTFALGPESDSFDGGKLLQNPQKFRKRRLWKRNCLYLYQKKRYFCETEILLSSKKIE